MSKYIIDIPSWDFGKGEAGPNFEVGPFVDTLTAKLRCGGRFLLQRVTLLNRCFQV
jgi:hypothetical protein